MLWKIVELKLEECRSLPQNFLLPPALEPSPIGLLFQKERRLYSLALPPSAGTPAEAARNQPPSAGTPTETATAARKVSAAAVVPFEALSQTEAWRCLLRIHPVPRTGLARYWLERLAPAGIPAEGLMRAYGLEPHYKNRQDWQEAAGLDSSSIDLAYIYNLPLRLLRLWNRLPLTERKDWLNLWQKRNFPLNIVGEIIADYYELSPADRRQALDWAREREARLQSRAGSTRRFAQELRDRVRLLRFPQSEGLRRELYRLKKSLSLPAEVSLEFPEDMEGSHIELTCRFDTVEKLRKLFALLSRDQMQAGIKQMIAKLQ